MLTRRLRRAWPHGRAGAASRTRPALAVVIVAFLTLGLTACQDPDTRRQEALLLDSVQNARKAARLAPLGAHAGLSDVARVQAQAMARDQRLYHSPDFANRVSSVLPNWTRIGENVGYGSSMDAISRQFMSSPAHRANILGNYNRVGVGVARDAKGRYWVVQVFALAN